MRRGSDAPFPSKLLLQLVAPDVAGFKDMADVNKTLKSLNIAHGSVVFFRYTVEREVTKNPVQAETRAFGAGPDRPLQRDANTKRAGYALWALTESARCSRPTGAKMTIQDMIAKQTRIERQELPRCQSVSFDGNAANIFQGCAPSLAENNSQIFRASVRAPHSEPSVATCPTAP